MEKITVQELGVRLATLSDALLSEEGVVAETRRLTKDTNTIVRNMFDELEKFKHKISKRVEKVEKRVSRIEHHLGIFETLDEND
jgi:hypothetical protein